MAHFSKRNEDLPSWPVGKYIVAKFPFYGDEDYFIVRAAMVFVSAKLKFRIEKAAARLATNQTLRTIQFYWPMQIVTNDVFGQPVLRQYAQAIRELLNSDFDQAIPDATARGAIDRVSDLDAITWISVGRPPMGVGGARVELGCTKLFSADFTTSVDSLMSEIKVPSHSAPEDEPKRKIRAINNAYDALANDDAHKP